MHPRTQGVPSGSLNRFSGSNIPNMPPSMSQMGGLPGVTHPMGVPRNISNSRGSVMMNPGQRNPVTLLMGGGSNHIRPLPLQVAQSQQQSQHALPSSNFAASSDILAMINKAGGMHKAQEFTMQKEDFPALPGITAKGLETQPPGDSPEFQEAGNGQTGLAQFPNTGTHHFQSKNSLLSTHSQAPSSQAPPVRQNQGYLVNHHHPQQQPTQGQAQPQSQPSSLRHPPGISSSSPSSAFGYSGEFLHQQRVHSGTSASIPSSLQTPSQHSSMPQQVQTQIHQRPQQHQSATKQPSKMSVHDRFGLLGLLNVIRMTDPDLNTLALGTDLTSLGLNPNSPDCLYATFGSPFADDPIRPTPEYFIPLCYYMQSPMQHAHMKIPLFSEETLFYIFYCMPRDLLQAAAAHELYKRDWRYHKTLKRWFTRIQGADYEKYPTYELGSYFYFEIKVWTKLRKDNFTLVYEDLEEKPPTINYSYVPTPANPPSRIVGSGSVARS